MGDLRQMSTGFQNEIKGAFNEADLQSRSSDRRNVLASSSSAPSPREITTAIDAVSDQPPATKAPAKKRSSAKAPAKKAPAKKAAAKKAPARKKAPAKKTAAKKTTT